MRFFPRRKEVPAPHPPDRSSAIDAIRFEGDFSSFDEALSACGGNRGYESDAAIERYLRRYTEVVGDLSATLTTSTPQLLPFMAAFSVAEPVDGIYEVLDFGGGYGAIYELFRRVYPDRPIRWTIVEVPRLVERGDEMGASQSKVFATEIPTHAFSLCIASSTLQYLPQPAEGFARLRAMRVPLMLVGRFPLVPSLRRDRLTVQHVPPSMFRASMPAWFFCHDWIDRLRSFGEIVMQWDSPKDQMTLDGEAFCMQAFLLRRG